MPEEPLAEIVIQHAGEAYPVELTKRLQADGKVDIWIACEGVSRYCGTYPDEAAVPHQAIFDEFAVACVNAARRARFEE